MTDIYCPMIHGGLNINFKQTNTFTFNQCCLSKVELTTPADSNRFWDHKKLIEIRNQNNENVWNEGCWECERLENAGLSSFRKSMIDKFGIKKNISGPQRIDLLFDRSCNLACVTCGPSHSTFWQKHLKEHNISIPIEHTTNKSSMPEIFQILKSMDLSNLEMLQFCGGETLMGNTYWKTAEFIADLIPDAVNKIEIAFQTNGTQPIDKKYYNIIEKFKLVKFFISLDSVQERFEYLRWPASWNQVVDNIMSWREDLPVNVMFFVQETTSCLNLYHYRDVPNWIKNNFSKNRLGDPIEYATQLAMHEHFNVNNITVEYFDIIKDTPMKNVLVNDWQENPDKIKNMLRMLNRNDNIRQTNWVKTFPEVAEFYSRYFNKYS